MIKAVLLDLDNTLLEASDSCFVQGYFHLVERYFRDNMNYDGMYNALINSVRAMQAARQYPLNNRQAAVQSLSKDSAIPPADLIAAFDTFYAHAYPSLVKHTAPIPAAPELVKTLQAAGYAVVIATNPVYPATAVYQRLAWAGLSHDPAAYALVTTGDNMHYIKPDPAYYAEILARVGVEPDEAVMVGNDPERDILPAQAMGIATYLVNCDQPNIPAVNGMGTTATFLQAVKEGWLENAKPPPLPPAAIEPELRGNVGALFGLLTEVQPHHWAQHPDPQEWSILQVVYHLLERESSVQRPRLERILHEDNPFLSVPPSPTMPTETDITEEGMVLAMAFAAEREQTLALVRSLAPQDWQRPAQHSIFSQTTLLEMAHFTAQHDRLHLTQICQTLGKCD